MASNMEAQGRRPPDRALPVRFFPQTAACLVLPDPPPREGALKVRGPDARVPE